MSSRLVRGLAAICIPLLLSSCGQRVVEADQVGFSKIEFDEKANQLHLAGGLREGFHVIASTSMTNRGTYLIIEMQIELTSKSRVRSGKTGSFDFHLALEGGVDRVLFGTERKIIWKRPTT
jgi:hypothetical protein